jgi:acetolactate decarboxylase
MFFITRFLLLAAAISGLCGCTSQPTPAITQVATIDALLAGVYEGHMSLADLRKHGDFGLGTFHHLDGEMILLDGVFYKAQADGKVTRPPLSETTPFATVVHFSPTEKATLRGPLPQKALEARIDRLAPQANQFCAFKVHGTFQSVRVRSVPAQKPPYPPLLEVTKNQPVFDFVNVKGTLVGFRSPAFVKGLNVPGYHIHFLNEDRTSGGHVLGLTMMEGTLEVDTRLSWLNVFLPSRTKAFAEADLKKDRATELEIVEQERSR